MENFGFIYFIFMTWTFTDVILLEHEISYDKNWGRLVKYRSKNTTQIFTCIKRS